MKNSSQAPSPVVWSSSPKIGPTGLPAEKFSEYLCPDYCFSCTYFRPTKGHFGICADMGSKVPYDGTRKGSACSGWRMKSDWEGEAFKLPMPTIKVVELRKGLLSVLGSVIPLGKPIHPVFDVERAKLKAQRKSERTRMGPFEAAKLILQNGPTRSRPIIGKLSFLDCWIRTLGQLDGRTKEITRTIPIFASLGWPTEKIQGFYIFKYGVDLPVEAVEGCVMSYHGFCESIGYERQIPSMGIQIRNK